MKRNAVAGLIAAIAITVGGGAGIAGYAMANHNNKREAVVTQAETTHTDAKATTLKAQTVDEKKAAAAKKEAAKKAAAEKAAAEKAAVEKAAAEKAAEKATQDQSEFDAIISKLTPGQGYAFVDMGAHHKALAVATMGCTDDGAGNPIAENATIYGYDSKGNVINYGTFISDDGIGCMPLKIANGSLMFGTQDRIEFAEIDESNGSMSCVKEASVFTDENGTVRYAYMDRDNHFEGEVGDNSCFADMMSQYQTASDIVFTVVA